MKKTIIAASVALLPSFAEAQQPLGSIPFYVCGTTDQIERTLTERYGESARFGGTSSPIHLDRYWSNDETGSWSFTRSNVESDTTCILNSGQNSRALRPTPAVLGEPI